MTGPEAEKIASGQRPALQIPDNYNQQPARRAIIELGSVSKPPAGGAPTPPGPVRDALVWIVPFGRGADIVQVAIDDSDGSVVRVLRTAGAVAPASPAANAPVAEATP